MECCPKLNFIAGERKYVCAKLTSCIGQVFTLSDASWELLEMDGTQVASGDCDVVDDGKTKTLRALVEPPGTGTYVLEFTYTIPPEIFIRRVAPHTGSVD